MLLLKVMIQAEESGLLGGVAKLDAVISPTDVPYRGPLHRGKVADVMSPSLAITFPEIRLLGLE